MSYRTSQASYRPEASSENRNDWVQQRSTNWTFQPAEFLDTPSARDGISPKDEFTMRSKGVSFLALVGMHLRLPQPTLYVASTILHRFYMRFSIKKHHYYDIGAACIFLSTKLEETTRKLKDIVIACCRVAQKNDRLEIDEQSKEYWRWRDIILLNEELLLEAICFDLAIDNPYSILVHYTRRFVKDEKERMALSKSAWAFVNDSSRTTLCLRYHTKVIAAAAFYCASRICRVGIPEEHGHAWWQQIDVDIRDIKDACSIMADIYDNGQPNGEQTYSRISSSQAPSS